MPAINGYYLTFVLLMLCAGVGIFVVARFRREVDHDLAPPTRREILDPLEQAFGSGLMHPEEIERIRESVRRQQVPTEASPGKIPTATRTSDPVAAHDPYFGEDLPEARDPEAT